MQNSGQPEVLISDGPDSANGRSLMFFVCLVSSNWYPFHTRPEDKATLGSDLSAEAGG